MGLKDNLAAEVKSTFAQAWDVQKTDSVPAPEDLRLNTNHAKDLEKATVLYADLDGSTTMVDWSCPNSPDGLTFSNKVAGFNDIGV